MVLKYICEKDFLIFIHFSFLLRQSAYAAGHLKVVLLECSSFWLFSVPHQKKKKHQLFCSWKSLHVSTSRENTGVGLQKWWPPCVLLQWQAVSSVKWNNADTIYLFWMLGCGVFKLQFCDSVHTHLPINFIFCASSCVLHLPLKFNKDKRRHENRRERMQSDKCLVITSTFLFKSYWITD